MSRRIYMSSSNVSEPVWRKSTRSSDPSIGACVEVAATDRRRAVRDSKNPGGPRLSFSVGEWRAFVTAIKSEEFEL
jgi:hypothetical protein